MRTSLCLSALATALVTVSAVAACSHDKPSSPTAQGAGSAAAGSGAAATASAPTPAAAGLPVFVNDASVATIAPAQLASWPRLDALVPAESRKLGTWELVSLQGSGQGSGAAPAEVAHPSARFPDMVPAVFPGEGGEPAFGMFDPVELARKGKPAMRQDHVTAIRIRVAQGGNRGQNDDGGNAAADPTTLVVTVKTAAGTTTLTGAKLLALPREPMPGNPDQKGWRLSALLDAAGVKAYEHLVLSGAGGTNLTLDKKDLDASTVPFIKLNKQGTLRFRLLKKAGEGWNQSGDLRALSAIEVK